MLSHDQGTSPSHHDVIKGLPLHIMMFQGTFPSHHDVIRDFLSAQVMQGTSPILLLQLKDVQSHHPIGYVSFITPSLELAYSFVFSPNAAG